MCCFCATDVLEFKASCGVISLGKCIFSAAVVDHSSMPTILRCPECFRSGWFLLLSFFLACAVCVSILSTVISADNLCNWQETHYGPEEMIGNAEQVSDFECML